MGANDLNFSFIFVNIKLYFEHFSIKEVVVMVATNESTEQMVMVAVDRIKPDPNQPRKRIDPVALAELRGSIEKEGLLEPIIIKSDPDVEGGFKLIIGERRWRCFKTLQLSEISAIVRDDIEDTLRVQVEENMKRSGLNPIEEGEAFKRLMDRNGWFQTNFAEEMQIRPHYVWQRLQLKRLPDEMKELVARGEMKVSHAVAILGERDHIRMRSVLREATHFDGVEGLTVKKIKLAAKRCENKRGLKKRQKKVKPKNRLKDSDALSIGPVATNLRCMLDALVGRFGEESPTLDEFEDRWQQLSPQQRRLLPERLEEIRSRTAMLKEFLQRLEKRRS